MENYFLVFIGILVICLIVSVLLFKKNIGGQFGFKKINGRCMKVNEAPHGIAGQDGTVYSNALACEQNTGGYPANDIMSYNCAQGGDTGGVKRCVMVPPGTTQGTFRTLTECASNCK